MDMNFGMRDENRKLLDRVAAMIRDEIMPMEAEYQKEIATGDRWTYTARQTEILEGLKSKAKAAGLWNFWLTDSDKGFGLSTVEYAYFAEEMGKTPLGAEVFNCSAPDTGNMETIARYGNKEQQKQWLEPLLAGEIRSAFAMTEPSVASSDAKNIATSAVLGEQQRPSRVIDGVAQRVSGATWATAGSGVSSSPSRMAAYFMCLLRRKTVRAGRRPGPRGA